MGTTAAQLLLAGKYTYKARLNGEFVFVKGGNQLTAARKLFRARTLPREWTLELIEDGQVIDWWKFDDLAIVLVPRAKATR